MMAWFRLIYVAIFAVALNSLFDMLYLVTDGVKLLGDDNTYLAQAELLRMVHQFDYGWLIGLVFFACHLFLLGSLMIKANYIPSLLGGLVVLAALGYLTDSFAHFLLPNYAAYREIFNFIALVAAAVGELSLCLWLLIKGKAGAQLVAV